MAGSASDYQIEAMNRDMQILGVNGPPYWRSQLARAMDWLPFDNINRAQPVSLVVIELELDENNENTVLELGIARLHTGCLQASELNHRAEGWSEKISCFNFQIGQHSALIANQRRQSGQLARFAYGLENNILAQDVLQYISSALTVGGNANERPILVGHNLGTTINTLRRVYNFDILPLISEHIDTLDIMKSFCGHDGFWTLAEVLDRVRINPRALQIAGNRAHQTIDALLAMGEAAYSLQED